MPLPIAPRVMCGKCKVPATIQVQYNYEYDTVTYTAVCHGKKESVVLTGMDMMESYKIEGATAFVQPLALEDGTHD